MSSEEKDKLVAGIYRLHIPDKVWRYENMPDIRKDFIQHCYLQLLEMSDEKFEELVNQGQITNYFYKICRRLAHPDSQFWAEYNGKIKFIYYGSYDDIEHTTNDYFE